MNHNPHKLKEGDHVILDKGFRNSSEVIIFAISKHSQMFCSVYSEDKSNEKWDVMTNRLTPKE